MVRTPGFVFFPDHFCTSGVPLLICCDTETISRSDQNLITTTEGVNSSLNLEDHPSFHLVDDLMSNCGEYRNQKRIAHGEIARVLEFPWAALIGYNIDNEIMFNCGGTLITGKIDFHIKF